MLKIKKRKKKYLDLCQSSIAIQIIYASDFLNKRFISLFSYPWRCRDRIHCQICAEVLDWSLKRFSFFRQISCNGNKSYNAVCKMSWLEKRLNSSAGRSILIAKTNLHNWFSWSPEYIEANQWPVSRDNSRIVVRFLRRNRMFSMCPISKYTQCIYLITWVFCGDFHFFKDWTGKILYYWVKWKARVLLCNGTNSIHHSLYNPRKVHTYICINIVPSI